MKELRILHLGFLLGVLAGCDVASQGELRVGSKSQSTFSANRSACYPGRRRDFSACVSVAETRQLQDRNRDYEYPDPHRDTSFPRGWNPEVYVAPTRLIDLSRTSESLAVAPNFVLGELMTATRGRYGVFSVHALQRIQRIRDSARAPLIINSAYRSPGYNDDIDGAAKWSRHTYGDAVDFYSPNLSLNALKDLCLRNGASFYQLYKSHIHCDWRNIEKDTAFFPSASAKQAFVTTAAALSDAAEITVSENAGAWDVNVELAHQEDSGELLYEWHVTAPDGQSHHFAQKTFRFTPTAPGLYRFSVSVGGSVEKSAEFVWQ